MKKNNKQKPVTHNTASSPRKTKSWGPSAVPATTPHPSRPCSDKDSCSRPRNKTKPDTRPCSRLSDLPLQRSVNDFFRLPSAFPTPLDDHQLGVALTQLLLGKTSQCSWLRMKSHRPTNAKSASRGGRTKVASYDRRLKVASMPLSDCRLWHFWTWHLVSILSRNFLNSIYERTEKKCIKMTNQYFYSISPYYNTLPSKKGQAKSCLGSPLQEIPGIYSFA
jgi:hypothetical protein